ncbi:MULTISPECIES: TonB-dependent receptor [unclassified Acinetobacter]|uniref:TonB-dependent receptor n=1 Tax=Acinetobacter TaxID=469 RepID=UPI0007D0419E|nr:MULTISPECIES: TonB-dependent receptor [unclassified Acinetobacter]OAL82056.1 TonB-dependent receptor [Acinetobacter sp. SFA]OAL82452.1 TonB-dependent receptor [Acinetobacter sp. SFD]
MKINKLVGSMGAPTVGKTILKLSTLTLSMMCLSLAHAADEPENSATQPTKVQKVTVTGSSIKGVAAQSASPITVLKVEDLVNQGVTTVEEALNRVSANQAGFAVSQNIGKSNTSGSSANLRGIGTDKTLILLNGRRLANSPFSTSEVNLNIIPLAMVERIEVLRDGASAVYGADAIAGVINFILKKEYQGFGISGGLQLPEHKNGDEYDVSIFGGYGDLDEQGFNVYGVIDYRTSDMIMAKDRKVSRRGGLIPELGMAIGSTAGFPANISNPGVGIVNPYINQNCNNAPNTFISGTRCLLNTQALIGITPDEEAFSALAKGTLKLTDSLNAVAEYVYTKSEVTTSIAPDVWGGSLTIPDSSKYYPGQGITPDIPGLTGTSSILYLRSQAGNRVSKSENESNRIFAGIEGEAYGWDLNGGVTYAKGEATDNFVSGYLNQSRVQAALNDGTLNPFGPQAPEDAGKWSTFDVAGPTNQATLDSTTVDFTLSRPIYELPAGEVGFAVGGSYTTQDWEAKINSDLVRQVPGSGIDPDKPISKGDRDITAIFTEFHIPIVAGLEAQLAARYDDYSDFGDSFNPKASLRWEPVKELMFRTSYSTGFRAPSLWEINSPQSETYTSSPFNNPRFCNADGTPNNLQFADQCGMQFKRKQGGNPDLQPEESTSYTAGFVYEPIKNLVFTADYYNIKIEDLVGTVSPDMIFDDLDRYGNLIVYAPDGRIQYLNTTLQNMGGLKTQGIDLSLNYLSPMTATGRFGFGIDGTYVIKMDYQIEPGGEWEDYVGIYDDPAVVRWKHIANVNWTYENWRMLLEQQYIRGYKDFSETRDVGAWMVYNFAGTYKGFKNLELTAGIKNMFDKEPPASDATNNAQYGYDPRHGDPTGRSYFLRGTYKFF